MHILSIKPQSLDWTRRKQCRNNPTNYCVFDFVDIVNEQSDYIIGYKDTHFYNKGQLFFSVHPYNHPAVNILLLTKSSSQSVRSSFLSLTNYCV